MNDDETTIAFCGGILSRLSRLVAAEPRRGVRPAGCESRRTPPSSYILHLAESLVIEPTADGARGTSYAFYPSSAGKYLNADTAGQLGFYHDEYVRTPNGWRMRTRRHELTPAIGSSTP